MSLLENKFYEVVEVLKKIDCVEIESKEIPWGIQIKFYQSGLKYTKKKDNINIYCNKKNQLKIVYGPKVEDKIKKNIDILFGKVEKKDSLGLDEAGKGDIFGPLVLCGVYLNSEMERKVKNIVGESKTVKRDKILKLYQGLKSFENNIFLEIYEPNDLNNLHKRYKKSGKSLNNILIEGYEKIVKNTYNIYSPTNIILDKFSPSISLYKNLENIISNKSQFFNETKAEKYKSVALASICAKGAYLEWINKASKELGFQINLGAGKNALESLYRLKQTDKEIGRYCKTFFKNVEV